MPCYERQATGSWASRRKTHGKPLFSRKTTSIQRCKIFEMQISCKYFFGKIILPIANFYQQCYNISNIGEIRQMGGNYGI